MGLVYAPISIERGHVPVDGAHEQAGRYILDTLQVYADPDKPYGIEAGMIYGSTVTGKARTRSDLDALVVFDPTAGFIALPRITEIFKAAEQQFNVRVEPHLTTTNALFCDLRHTIDPLFAGHLVEVQRMRDPTWSFNNPVDPLVTRTNNLDMVNIKSLALAYSSTKAKKFAEAHSMYRGDIDYKIYQRAFELPGAIGRKVLKALSVRSEKLPNLDHRPSITGLVMKRLVENVDDNQRIAVTHQLELVELDAEYNRLLHATLNGNVGIKEYEEWLQKQYLRVCKMAFSVSQTWADILANSLPGSVTRTSLSMESVD